jgi:hypothetical protein
MLFLSNTYLGFVKLNSCKILRGLYGGDKLNLVEFLMIVVSQFLKDVLLNKIFYLINCQHLRGRFVEQTLVLSLSLRCVQIYKYDIRF